MQTRWRAFLARDARVRVVVGYDTSRGRCQMEGDVDEKIESAVFKLMETTDIPDIRVADVLRLAGVSRSTFYRHFDSVDDVVKRFESGLLDNMRRINNVALKARFGISELDPTSTMVSRMELLQRNRDKIVALNGPNGDPSFVHKATIFMHDYFRARLETLEGDPVTRDLYLSFVIAGHNNLVQYWLEVHPEIEPQKIAAVLNRLYYAPFFLSEESVRQTPKAPEGWE
ncbi:MAG: TetR/AcrR family transcriptional regulator [Coriobacteriaceae bacterium]|jgi:AcrR family transcriptional regulator|nr:MAG: TetR/AcrR family transcriptional regulator [Coriobacteriaceae bacterium]